MQNHSESPDIFESSPDSLNPDHAVLNIEESISESNLDNNDWRGTSMYDILRDNNPWNHYTSPINPSKHHTVMFQLPVTLNSPPKPRYSHKTCHWNQDNVKMPFSPKNLYPVKDGKKDSIKPRWNLIELVLLRPILNCVQLEEAIFSYNLRHCRFNALHYFFQEVLEDEESQHFFSVLLPKIIQLALQLPELMPSSLPLLKQGKAHSVSISQIQIASLLANAFLCTFPWRKHMITYPGINFNRLYECRLKDESYIIEKLKCLVHYFRRVCNNPPTGVVTFERKYLTRSQLPRWDKLETSIANTKLHIANTGTIEDGGLGLLQVDFANSMVGGGVLSWGCVQEEIRFLICPELLVSRLFTEQLGSSEALLITGVECFSKYRGYSDTFEWAGNCEDETPFDISGRRRTSIVAIDALYYSNPSVQFSPSKMIRELNKAYVGFCEDVLVPRTSIAAVATGNWGCGAFRGNLHLKAILQIMACTAANRDIVYYTFGDSKLRDIIHSMHQFLTTHKITVVQLWRYLCRFNEMQLASKHLFSYIQQAHLDSLSNVNKELNESQLDERNFVTNMTTFLYKKNPHSESSVVLSQDIVESSEEICTEATSKATSMEIEDEDLTSTEAGTSHSSDQIIESSQDIIESPFFKSKFVHPSQNNSRLKRDDKDKMKHKELVSFFYSSDEDENDKGEEKCSGLLSSVDSLKKNDIVSTEILQSDIIIDESSPEKMEVCQFQSVEKITDTAAVGTPHKISVHVNKEKTVNKKISDYFKKIPK